jgi:hypothetical protein
MSRITLDPDLKARLNGLNEHLEVCDESGRTLGHFLPEAAYQKMLYALAESQRPPLSSEEVERRRKETGGRPLAAIWKRLGQS